MIVDSYNANILNAKKISLKSSTTSIHELKGEIDLQVFPSPAQDLVNISFDTPKTLSKVSLILNDIHGNEVRRVKSIENNKKVTLDTEGLVNGMYFVHLVSDGRIIAVKKLIVVR